MEVVDVAAVPVPEDTMHSPTDAASMPVADAEDTDDTMPIDEVIRSKREPESDPAEDIINEIKRLRIE